jgi:DNA-binding protein HU-beta
MSKRHIPTGRLNHMALVAAVANESGETQETVASVLRAVFDVIPRNLVAGFPVNVTNFGTWYPAWNEARTVRNPQTGETWEQPGRLRPAFRWAPAVKDAVTGKTTDGGHLLPETFKKRSNR